jgi:ATP-dependent Clp protease protease subunit
LKNITKGVLIAAALLLVVATVLFARRAMSGNCAANRDSGSSDESLLGRRIVLLDGELTEENAKWVIAKLLFLQHQDPADPIHLWVDSEGGNVLAGLAIIDTIKGIRPPVCTLCRGRAHGIAAVILASGARGHRVAQANAALSIVPLVWTEGKVVDEAAKRRLLQDLVAMVAEQTGLEWETVQGDFERGRLFDAPGARSYGLIDTLVD